MFSFVPISIWLTGLPCSGKTTLGKALFDYLQGKGMQVKHFDGDEVRKGLCSDLGYSAGDRRENIRRVAEVSKLFLQSGFITINSFICPLEEYRELVKNIIGRKSYIEVFVNTPFEICEKRDNKGMYKKARLGELEQFTGISAPFEVPVIPDLVLNNGNISPEEAVENLVRFVIEKLK